MSIIEKEKNRFFFSSPPPPPTTEDRARDYKVFHHHLLIFFFFGMLEGSNREIEGHQVWHQKEDPLKKKRKKIVLIVFFTGLIWNWMREHLMDPFVHTHKISSTKRWGFLLWIFLGDRQFLFLSLILLFRSLSYWWQKAHTHIFFFISVPYNNYYINITKKPHIWTHVFTLHFYI